jgi:intracellular multiplication protein IcmL
VGFEFLCGVIMSDDSIELIRLRNNFYRDNYRRIMKLLLILTATLVVMIAIIFYLLAHRPQPKYFATTQAGRVLELIPLSTPMLSSTALLNWASELATATFTYNYLNYRQQIQALQPNFGANTWKDFLAELKKGNIEAMVKRKLAVTAVPSGAPVILSQGNLNGRYTWKVQVPILAKYVSASDTYQNQYLVTMTIVRVSTLENQNGVAVSQYVV